MISHGRILDWNGALGEAARWGHREIVEDLIAKGADDWNYGLDRAASGGHREIMDLMIANGADNLD